MTDQDEPRDPEAEDTAADEAAEEEAPEGDAADEPEAGEGDPAGEDPQVDLSWLAALEDRVREAVDRLHGLETENARLRDRVDELEEQLEEAGEAAAAPAPAPAAESAAAEGWRQERDEIRTRVQRLTGDLESLLGED